MTGSKDERKAGPVRGELSVFALEGIPEVAAGADLAGLILAAAEVAAAGVAGGTLLSDGDILAVTSKIVSKAEGRLRAAADREQAITEETVRVVATRAYPGGVTRIVENRQGLVMAAAGVDASNTPEGFVLLLPADPDASARALCAAVRARTGLRLGVIITDTAGRPWREGQTDIAIGAAGVAVLDDLRGTTDAAGKLLNVTAPAVGDEIAGAADLVKGKASGNPVAVIRGLGRLVLPLPAADPVTAGSGVVDRGAAILLRPSETDMFRLGSAEAEALGYTRGYAAGLAAGLTAAEADLP
ncbi:coenzyme F420-0:L-glutamate ligase [Cryobacterium sp. 10I1]|uniref:coenzyme F420-0:L-glutamate ligase n=1 Tax=unclassified Cryobacterium TaxID=2649013 RepID=UPI002AC9EA34|nr:MULTISPECIES: coenzyme F420-0:L-glutamate ligase [unclassified Cryobacterium]MEB0004577.1 coenzyme F420-0:L-glutamate ligase [Cryobacterium sp. RTC2.1]MEB0287815.1 coenzyme F420-0:L-glutamate ligase [Cryobacterium sp. 10S3]MEB0307104.1 coenzyme F420-0:L-glutamate ligase [Cryobacterium sp. 10I1]WPX13612.1 coenzyme F420-0:L-glutamate ligase [Cryobacterium sp. 10S3]